MAKNPGAEAQQLRVAIGRVARRMRQLYAEHDVAEPSFTEIAVLHRLLRDGPQSPTELSGRERVTSQAIAAVTRELQTHGLVTRTQDIVDRRRWVVTITAAGRDALNDRENVVMRNLVRVLTQECAPAERQQLAAAMPLLNRIADCL